MKLYLGRETNVEEMRWEIDAELTEFEFEIEFGGDIELEAEFTTSEDIASVDDFWNAAATETVPLFEP